jgi:hypothetical protein
LRDRHGRWVRDAVDASCAFDDGAASGRRSRVVLTPRRWRQVRGKPFRGRRWQTSPVTGESTKETVKTIAQGVPGRSGVPVVTMLVCFFFAHKAAGAASARHSLRPLFARVDRSSTRAHRVAGMRSRVFSLAPFLRGEGWGEGLDPQIELVESPPHPNCCAIRPLPASGAR